MLSVAVTPNTPIPRPQPGPCVGAEPKPSSLPPTSIRGVARPRERGAHDDGGKDERHQHQGLQEPAAPELQARERVSGGQTDGERKRGRGRRLPEREPDHAAQVGVAEHPRDRRYGQAPLRSEPRVHDRGQGEQEEQAEEEYGDRDNPGRMRPVLRWAYMV